ncbi:MAG: NAD(P)/FAD-dependent oxidoreductase [Pseudomonadota bacterium]
MKTETLIIGGGLSGLRLALALAEAGRDFLLVEARERLGGRILSVEYGGAYFDLGPTWFWPGQPRIHALIERLGLAKFEQFAIGAHTYEDADGRVQRGQGFAAMQGSYRLIDGMAALIDGLSAQIPEARIYRKTEVRKITRTVEGVQVVTAAGHTLNASNVVLALPPRLSSQLAFSPPLGSAALLAMDDTDTWMAGQAKAIAIYDQPIWRDAGLSGDAMSRRGPMVEIHDASPADGGPYALFGFIGVPAQARRDEAALRHAVVAQFSRLFGAGAPKKLFIKDWACDPHTSTARDAELISAHPSYGQLPALPDVWKDRLIFSGTEATPEFGGFLEGALEAAEIAFKQLENARFAMR